MVTTPPRSIDFLTIKGFKSIRQLERFPLRSLNVLIGANGVGKSNFVSYFHMLRAMMNTRLQRWVAVQGGADRILTFGVKETTTLESSVEFGDNKYAFSLEPTVDDQLIFVQEKIIQTHEGRDAQGTWSETVKDETLLKLSSKDNPIAKNCCEAISGWRIFHFNDTSETSRVKRKGSLIENDHLHHDASNLAAFLYRLSQEFPDVLEQIRKTVQLAVPFFDDFVFKPETLPTEEAQIRLLWKHKNSDYTLWPSQLSDGSIRWICLVTALLQLQAPNPIAHQLSWSHFVEILPLKKYREQVICPVCSA